MNNIASEHDEIDALKRWWKANGKSLIVGVILGITIVVGYKMWTSYQESRSERASTEYDQMLNDIAADQMDAALDRGRRLVDEFSDLPYGPMASLLMAKVKVGQGDLPGAATHLRVALENTSDTGVKHVARLRLARVLLAQNDADGALKLVENVETGEYAATYAEVTGDAKLAMGRLEEARADYSKALDAVDKNEVQREQLKIKLDSLGGAVQDKESDQKSDAADQN